jgi:hypothetical protein
MGWKPEKEIQAEIVKFLTKDAGIFFKVIHVQGLRCQGKDGKVFLAKNSMKGMADIYSYVDKQFTLWIEVKSATGTLSDDQKKFQQLVEDQGQYFLIARSVDDVKYFLENTVRAVLD